MTVKWNSWKLREDFPVWLNIYHPFIVIVKILTRKSYKANKY